MTDFFIEIDNLTDGQVFTLLEQHRQEMLKFSPPSSVHALDTDALKQAEMTVWSARRKSDNRVIGCVGLKLFTPQKGEIKSMKVADDCLRMGLGRALLRTLLQHAANDNMTWLGLETGTHEVFAPARKLYETHDFKLCEPFAGYTTDPHSVCYERIELE